MNDIDKHAIDARVYEEIFGNDFVMVPCVWGEDGKRVKGMLPFDLDGEEIPNYTTDANHDYSVLKHVRENWSESDLSLFGRQLIAIRINRGSKRSLSWIEGIDYQIGDYAMAALAVKGE